MQKHSDISPQVHIAKTTKPFFGPTIQPKLTINQPNDIYEQEADAIAGSVMRMPEAEKQNTFFRAGSSPVFPVQRKCAHCKEEESVQLKGATKSTGGILAPPVVHQVINSGGKPLDHGTRNFMESRFGNDFGNVRVHDDSLAHQSSAEINALAYTHGNHVVFGKGQYSPDSNRGKQLLAHELVHVEQQNGNAGIVQRVTIGSSPLPDWSVEEGQKSFNIRPVPPEDVERVNEAISMIQEIIDHPDEHSACIAKFIYNCKEKVGTAFKTTFDNAIIWKIDDVGSAATLVGDSINIGYTQEGYDSGARDLARSILHEMGHLCEDENHSMAEEVAYNCLGYQNRLSMSVILDAQTGKFRSLGVSYRRLRDLAWGGRLQWTGGFDVDARGIYQEIIGAKDESELLNFTTGPRFRLSPLDGGEGYGGLTLGVEGGVAGGRFRTREETETPEAVLGAGLVIKTSLGLELVKSFGDDILKIPLEVNYKFIQPANKEGLPIHEFMITALATTW